MIADPRVAAAASTRRRRRFPPRLRVQDLRRRFGARAALDGVSFDVWPGEIFGLLGPNGAGKTTAFRLLSGLIPADGGSLEMDGAQVTAGERALSRAPGRGVPGAQHRPQADRTREPGAGRGALRPAARAGAARIAEALAVMELGRARR